MRRRFKTDRICSSDNYNLSRKLHKAYLIEHKITLTPVRKAYVKCFGSLIPITIEEAKSLETTVTIIWQ